MVVNVSRREGQGRFVIVCEHASNDIPPRWGDLGLSEQVRQAHVAWDPGALGVAKALAEILDAPLVHAAVSRLVYDLNRAPHMRSAMPERSEIHDIPGNVGLTPADRLERTRAVYIPFHAALRELLTERLASGLAPVVVTIHSFTPVYHGRKREVEFGVIHDADPSLATAVMAEAAKGLSLVTRLNEPYSAEDDVTHTLALHATPLGIENVMLEIRNDLIAGQRAQSEVAAELAAVLQAALARLDPPESV